MNRAELRRYIARTKKDREDPEGAPKRARERERRRARRAEEEERRFRERIAEEMRERQRPRPMIEWIPGAFPREEVEKYQREKRARVEAEAERRAEERSRAYFRKRWKKQGLSEEEIAAKFEEMEASRERLMRMMERGKKE